MNDTKIKPGDRIRVTPEVSSHLCGVWTVEAIHDNGFATLISRQRAWLPVEVLERLGAEA